MLRRCGLNIRAINVTSRKLSILIGPGDIPADRQLRSTRPARKRRSHSRASQEAFIDLGSGDDTDSTVMDGGRADSPRPFSLHRRRCCCGVRLAPGAAAAATPVLAQVTTPAQTPVLPGKNSALVPTLAVADGLHNRYARNGVALYFHINAVGFMQQHFKDLLDNKKYVDVTFVVEGQPVPAHRLILASQSDYFDRLFYGKMREANSSDEIPLPNAPLEALRLLLEFMYSGCLDYDNQPLQERLCAVMCITEVDRNLLHEAILCPANTGLHPRIESLLSMKQGGSPTHADQVIYLGSIPHKSYAHERDSHTHHQPSSCILDLGDHYLVNYIELQGYPTASHPDRCRLCFLYTLKVSRDKLHWHKLFDFSVFKCCGNQHLCFPQQVVSEDFIQKGLSAILVFKGGVLLGNQLDGHTA
eukprot:Em0001g183a